MNKLVVAILACVAGAAFGDYLIRDSSGVMIDVPKNGGYLVELDPNVTRYMDGDSSDAQLPDFDEIEYTVYFYYAHQGRTIKTELFIDDASVQTHNFGDEYSTVSYKLENGKRITSTSSIVFTVYGECSTCINSITIIFWARLKKDGAYISDLSEKNPLPLYFKGYSPMFSIDKGKGNSKYFIYESENKVHHIVYKHKDITGKITFFINEDDADYSYEMDDIIDNITFKKGTNTIRAEADHDKDKTYIEIGAFEEASSTIKAMSFLALCVLGALLF